ncbi:hypothetical protein PPERSA_03912 [Pseudocohnilembus persalinus]|uniref:Uncharacterized protein n=1 Tax=Pseudocohnilembus persalinus TaxID=266149 RepID=A0A0V0Q973_PSEPJ|nr:hypothetical protein PPERSA_03912 [Pseudocohnilembus persalinus]|eukprot:KRW98777.1 hypothetical protein PPERSA_03912 [Pseudocohnilembus persalinus]
MADPEELDMEGEENFQNEDDRPEEEDEETIRIREAVQKFKEDIKSGLSQISKIQNNQSWAYVKLNLAEKELDKLYPPLLEYKHLRHLDISGNALTDISLVTDLQFLTTLNCSKNQIPSLSVFNPEADEPILPYLQFLDLSGNKIQILENIKIGRLRKLVLNENEIVTAQGFEGHPTLEYLEIKQNKVKNLQGFINMPNLKELNLEENEITHFRDLRDLPKLQKVILAKNKIKKIKAPLPYLPSMTYLSLAENEITQFPEVLSLAHLTTLNSIALQGNDIQDVEDIKVEILIFMDHFIEINDEIVKKSDRAQAKEVLDSRIEEAERLKKEEEEEQERIRLEEEERLKQEEEERLAKEEEERKEREEQERIEKEQAEKEKQEQEEQQKKEQEEAEKQKQEENPENKENA